MNSSKTAQASTYDLSIQYKSDVYRVHLMEDPSYRLEWRVNGPVEFRLEKGAIYLKRAVGGESKFPIRDFSTVASPMPELPFPSAHRQPVLVTENGIPMEKSTEPPPQRCTQIASMGPQFDLLAKACDFALSRYSLPSLICKETTHRFINEQPLDVVTEDVVYQVGRGDRYSDFTIDGQPEKSLEGTGGLITGALFGSQLRTIFDPDTRTDFTFRGETKVGLGTAAVYSFSFRSEDDSTYRLDDIFPSLAGTIWVDRFSGQLMRVQTHATNVAPGSPFSSYHSTVNFDDVTIPELGPYLVPRDGEAQMCSENGARCSRNVVAFRSYRKYGATVKIVT